MVCTRSASSLAALSISLLLMVACSGLSPAATATPPPTSTVDVAVVEDLAQTFISAVEAKQAAEVLALFSDEGIFLDNSTPFRSYVAVEPVRNSASFVRNLYQTKNFSVKFDSHIVSRDGRFVALTGTYSNTGKDGNLA